MSEKEPSQTYSPAFSAPWNKKGHRLSEQLNYVCSFERQLISRSVSDELNVHRDAIFPCAG